MYVWARDINARRWFSGKISRCHRDAPGSIPGRRTLLYLLLLTNILHIDSFISLFYIEPTIYLSKIRRLIHTTTLTLALTIFDDQLHICDNVCNCRSKVDRYTVGRF